MRTAALYGAAGAAGSLILSALAAAPAAGTPPYGAPEDRGTVVAAARAVAAGITFGACPAEEDLPPTVECAAVRVPLDYADPWGRQIDLAVSRVKATGGSAVRQGALLYNPGGPGGSGMYFPALAKEPAWKRIAEAYDMVGYAPRGVGRSAPISCEHPMEFTKGPTASPVHPTAAEKREGIARARAYARGCAHNAGPALRHYNSLNNVRDLEVLRAALGERQLTFLGASYGTYLGALYAVMFPERVRRMVLDSPVDPDPAKVWYRSNLEQSLAFENRWADFRAWVARHHATYGLGSTPQRVQASYDRARALLARKPAGGTVGPGQLQSAFTRTVYNDLYWPRRALALSAYLKGDPRQLVKQAKPRASAAAEEENGNAVYTAVQCNDAPWPADWAVWDRDNTALARRAPFETWANVWMNLPCAYWEPPRQRPVDVRTGPGDVPPLLILAAERDAATPYAGALRLQERLAGSVLVTERGAGTHGISGGDNDCVNGHMEAYLLTGRTPVRRASCAPHPQPDPVSLDQRAVERVLPPAV
ncbi:alpha/beta hydrolase [Streptomyces wuyuanensis]|uniref:Alpha/beta hydrolase fold n=1 Tax=Streptomyces wuyuanensis TaxID=1196353 RepID=A0A1G9MSP5_9ACTN|nr:alpha/beta hydrolase [Streptomyces wuyuanensis]SDL76927.1 alpha/beta hydrolase fold [Streptomyces wuyuanensis]